MAMTASASVATGEFVGKAKWRPLEREGTLAFLLLVPTFVLLGAFIAYPFLRADNTDAKMCVTCHKDRDQHWQDAEGGVANAVPGGKLTSVTLGVTKFSHPVGQALNQDGRTNGLAAILDANGMVQAVSTDPNKTNDLVLGTAGIVTCLSCHHPHNADSNSLSVDPR